MQKVALFGAYNGREIYFSRSYFFGDFSLIALEV